jgi:hypothetical protein
MKSRCFSLILVFAVSLTAHAQQQQKTSKAPVRPAARPAAKNPPQLKPEVARSRKFVLDVVQSAVGVQEPDPQDRLRVLATAIPVVMGIDTKVASQLAAEGVRIESDLIANGQQPVISVLALGYADCKSATEFVNRIYPANIQAAEQSLIGAFSKCPKQTGETIRMRVDAAMDQNISTPRLLLALMENAGAQSPWAQQHFEKMFGAMPSDPAVARKQATEIANAYAQMAPLVEKGSATDMGVKLLAWLGKLEESGDRNLAINATVGAMTQLLGEDGFDKALEKDVMARQAAGLAGEPGSVTQPEQESATISDAMQNSNADATESLKDMPPSKRAREAAAHGFVSGTQGDRKGADRYFDMAFSAADEAWDARTSDIPSQQNAADVVEEVSEAAAQVDSVNALARAQALQDPTSRAIGMIAVARVVMSNNAQQQAADARR